jgi:UDP-N-acetyl-D-mannosaminuronate dehydrogenase
VTGCDALVVMVAHDAYRSLDMDDLRGQVAHAVIVDGRHILATGEALEAGWLTYVLGIGQG